MDIPDVSFAIASYNAAPFIDAAVTSALKQRGVSVEIVIVDDHSTDASLAVANAMAERDGRIRVFQTPQNLGPAGARNIAIREARGQWFAVLDSDDLIHADRSQRLIAEAVQSGADVVADDLIVFDDAQSSPPDTFLRERDSRQASWIDLPRYLRETAMFGSYPNLGFLKPMIRLDFLRRHGIAYDEQLKVAEDDDLIIRLLTAQAKYRLLPRPLYFYRKHGASISHRLSVDHADRMLAAGNRLRDQMTGAAPPVRHAFERRDTALRRVWAFTHMLEAVRQVRPTTLIRLGLAYPQALPLFRMPVAGAFRKLFPKTMSARVRSQPDPAAVLFISRQRLIGATNGSSAYLIALADAVRAAGKVPHLIQPSSLIFGRTPFFRLRPEMDVFETIHVHGSARFGRTIFARDGGIYLAAARGVLARIFRRLGIGGRYARDHKAPYSVSAPWPVKDLLYVTHTGRNMATTAIADYMFQAEAIPYLIDPDVRSATVMHDLFSARSSQFDRSRVTDSVAAISEADEIALLGNTDAVIAIQADEAEFVRRCVPGATAILAPMAQKSVDAAQPGEAKRLLFVGSNTAPNIHGLRWFLDAVWPTIVAQSPDSLLDVAGSVYLAFDHAVEGVRFRGMVDDLAPLYAAAGVVISPLLQGSGLKIKLIEALAHGKACVVTGITLQGVEDRLRGAVVRADMPDEFAQAVVRLQTDGVTRRGLAEAGLAAARTGFSPEAAYRVFRDWLNDTTAKSPTVMAEF